ncbi:MAG: alanine racemase [Zetaproteobacteria bacterium]|nr:MAG: alanine racemase [Zetaproteobacteria bacterium]
MDILSGRHPKVLVLSPPEDDEALALFRAHSALRPVIADLAHLRAWIARGGKQAVWVKLETGMHRLGEAHPERLAEAAERHGIPIEGALSHLALADRPQHPLTQAQVRRFQALCAGRRWMRSLANSAGLASLPPEAWGDLVRVGIALYGVEPAARIRRLGLRPVMELQARVLQIKSLEAGDAVSYDASFVAPKPMRVAVLAAGYADGVPRGLSNRGMVELGGALCPIVGRVCMDYTIVDVTHACAREGDWASFWGTPGLPVEDACARMVGEPPEIPYTLLSNVGARVVRMARKE